MHEFKEPKMMNLSYTKFEIVARVERWAQTQNKCSRFANVVRLVDDTYAAIMGNEYTHFAFFQTNSELEAIQKAWQMLTPLLSEIEEEEKQQKERQQKEAHKIIKEKKK